MTATEWTTEFISTFFQSLAMRGPKLLFNVLVIPKSLIN